ncbi:hypothetical protein HUU42_14570 [bacterium]|nr:hypothetical protein [bacterium]
MIKCCPRDSLTSMTVASKMPDEYAVLLRDYLATASLDFSAVTGVAIGSVVPTLTRSHSGRP